MIRFAQKNDRNNIITLWNTSFGDEAEFSQWFFSNSYKPENTLVYISDGEIVSMLQRLPYKINNLGDVTYIFGACTHPDFRGQGLMEKLIKFSKLKDIENSVSACILIPQNPGLFDFYNKFGFRPSFCVYSSEMIKATDIPDSSHICVCGEKDIDTLDFLYQNSLNGTSFVYRERDYWKLQLDMFSSLGGNVFMLDRDGVHCGYAFVWNDNKKPYIQELVCIDENAKTELCSLIMEHYDITAITAFSLDRIGQEHTLGSAYFYNTVENCNLKINLMYN